MSLDLTAQMRDFALSLQEAMAEHIQRTMKRQAAILSAAEAPVEGRVHSVATGVHDILVQQMDLLVRGLTGSPSGLQSGLQSVARPGARTSPSPSPGPPAGEVDDFSASLQRIIREQMRVFAASVANPTPEELALFFAAMRGTMADQVQLAADLQAVMARQMQRLMQNLDAAPSDAP